ncbi:MAG: PQQ-binding-like beta-propeller repeat protein [Planctomycetota bacterium]
MRKLHAAIVALSMASILTAAQAEWPGWRGPNRDGKSPDTGLLKAWPQGGPDRVWEVDFIGSGFSAVAVVGGRIYTTGHVDRRLILFAMDMDGRLQWKKDIAPAYRASHPGSRSTPMIHDGKLYLVGGNGQVFCGDAATGRELWTRHMKEFGGKRPDWGYAESVLIHKDMAIVKPGGRKGCIVALQKDTGKLRWQSPFAAGAEYSSCVHTAFEGKDLVLTGTRSGIVCVDAHDGSLYWSNPWCAGNTANCPDPVVSDDLVFWANGYGKGGICLEMRAAGDRVQADKVYTTRNMNCHHGGYIIHQGYVYGNNGGGWACLELATGRRQWYERAVGKGSLCWADGMLYLYGEGGGRAALATCSPEGLEVKGRVQVDGRGPSWAHPVVIGGRLYLRYDTHLYCFDVSAR